MAKIGDVLELSNTLIHSTIDGMVKISKASLVNISNMSTKCIGNDRVSAT